MSNNVSKSFYEPTFPLEFKAFIAQHLCGIVLEQRISWIFGSSWPLGAATQSIIVRLTLIIHQHSPRYSIPIAKPFISLQTTGNKLFANRSLGSIAPHLTMKSFVSTRHSKNWNFEWCDYKKESNIIRLGGLVRTLCYCYCPYCIVCWHINF